MIRKTFIPLVIGVALLSGCNSNAPKYESVLDEMLSLMSPDTGQEGVHLVEEDVELLKETFRDHSGFGKAEEVKNLRDYLFPIDENMMFNSSDGVEACVIDKEIYKPAVYALAEYSENGGEYPSELILRAIYHLQEQYARAMDIDPQIGIGAAIWLNRFTQQALNYCPDISQLASVVESSGDAKVGIIQMPEGEIEPLTNIIVVDFHGVRQNAFGIKLFVNQVHSFHNSYGTRWLLYGDEMAEEFEALVLEEDSKHEPHVIASSRNNECRQAIEDWLMPSMRNTEKLNIIYSEEMQPNLISIPIGEEGNPRVLKIIEDVTGCRFEFNPVR